MGTRKLLVVGSCSSPSESCSSGALPERATMSLWSEAEAREFRSHRVRWAWRQGGGSGEAPHGGWQYAASRWDSIWHRICGPAEASIKDSVDDLVKYWSDRAEGTVDPAQLKFVAERSGATIDW